MISPAGCARPAAVHDDHERVTAEVPGLVWTAGQAIPFKVRSGNAAARRRRRVGYCAGRFRLAGVETDWGVDLAAPADFAGLYQLRIAPTLNPQAESEYAPCGD